MDNCITKFLDLGNVLVDNVQSNFSSIVVDVSTVVNEVVCTHCGHTTKKVHDYRIQNIKRRRMAKKCNIAMLRRKADNT